MKKDEAKYSTFCVLNPLFRGKEKTVKQSEGEKRGKRVGRGDKNAV